jgi:queuine tRNA-ribosyltransferase
VRHLFNVNEILGVRLLSVHNLHQMAILMQEIRAALDAGVFEEFRKEFLEANKEDR